MKLSQHVESLNSTDINSNFAFSKVFQRISFIFHLIGKFCNPLSMCNPLSSSFQNYLLLQWFNQKLDKFSVTATQTPFSSTSFSAFHSPQPTEATTTHHDTSFRKAIYFLLFIFKGASIHERALQMSQWCVTLSGECQSEEAQQAVRNLNARRRWRGIQGAITHPCV